MENSLRAKELVKGSKEEQQARFCGKEKSPTVVIKHRESDEQRDNLFHSRCFIDGKLVSLVIDGGSCENIVSLDAVNKLGLKTQRHPQPYQLSWINEHGTINVTKQVLVRFNLGQYEDEVLCDVAPMQTAHLLLGRPWQFDRKVTHEGWTNYYKFQHQGKKFVLKPLSPDDVYNDQRQMEEKRNTGKASRAQMWVQRHMGFNFMSFRKHQKAVPELEPAACNELCLSPEKQSYEASSHADDEEAKMELDAANYALLEVEERSKKRGEGRGQSDDGRIVSATRAVELPILAAKQRKREGQLVGLIGEVASKSNNAETFSMASGSSPLEKKQTNSSVLQNQSRAQTPLQTLKHEQTTSEWVGKIGPDSSKLPNTESFHNVHGTYISLQFDPKSFQSTTPNSEIFTRKFGEAKEESIGEIGSESNEKETMGNFGKVQVSSSNDPLEEGKPKSQTHNFCLGSPDSGFSSSETGIFKSSGGGKLLDDDWRRFRDYRCTGVAVIDCWDRYESILCNELDRGGLGTKSPNLELSPEFLPAPDSANCWPESVSLSNSILGQIFFVVWVECEPWSPTKRLEQIECELEAAIVMPKIVFAQPTFDPIWDQFCEWFEQTKDKVLRATLFQEGGPDMIPNCPPFTSQLFDKEAIKVGKKKGRIWLCQNPCSGYILWRHGSLNWLGGNSILRVCFSDKVTIFLMVCFMDPEDVIKVVFQVLKVATSKLENCQKMAKAGNCFVKSTLELSSRSMDPIRDQRLLQHQTRYVFEQREGIG
ncbi:unnamed protein product [Linum trigynum]|uniref:Uncharacterized protein n=1 Tax=Linum trigynum TaxID=586398 RepID=A0AAV2FPP4_9ROSI